MTDSDVCDARKAIFERGKQANEEEKYDEAFAAITEIVAFGSELSNDEIELVNWVVNNKITNSEFGDEKKDACYATLDLMERIPRTKNNDWLNNYESALFDCFTKLNRVVRDEERENAWCRLKELYLEVLSLTRKIWKEKNSPERLAIFDSLAKLCKNYQDVADEETVKMCADAAQEALYLGHSGLDDDEHRDASASIHSIKRSVALCEEARQQKNDSGED